MVTVSQIAVNLSAQTAQFEKGMKKSTDAIKSFANDIGKIGNIGSIAGGITFANILNTIGAKLKAVTVDQFAVIDANAKLSDRLGISTAQLAALQLASDLAGVGAEELGMNLSKLQKGLGEAVNNGGPLDDTLQRLGLNAREVASIPLDQALTKIGVAINAIQNPAQRAAVATELLGKSGQRMINVLGGGAESFQQAADEAAKFGLSIDRIDAAKVEAANDSMTRAKAAITGLGTQLAVQLAPALEAIAVKFTEAATAGEGMKGTIGPAIEYVAKAIGIAADVTQTIGLGFNLAQIVAAKAIKGIVDGLKFLIDAAREAGAAVGISIGAGASEFLATFSEELDKTIGGLSDKFDQNLIAPAWSDKVSGMFSDIKKSADEAAKKIAETNKVTNSLSDSLKKPGKFAVDAGKQVQDKLLESLQSPIEKFKNQMSELKDLAEFNIITPEQFTQLSGKFFQDTIQGSLKEVGNAPRGAEAGTQEAFARIDAFQRANDPNKTLKQQLDQLRIQTGIQQNLAKDIGTQVGSLIGKAEL